MIFLFQTCFTITLNKVCPCNPDVSLTYDHVTDSDFEDDVQDKLITQYYSYADRGQNLDMSGSGDDELEFTTIMRQHNEQQYNPRDMHDLRKNRNSNFLRQSSIY